MVKEHFGKRTLAAYIEKSYENMWFATLFKELLLYPKNHPHLLKIFLLYMNILKIHEYPENLKES